MQSSETLMELRFALMIDELRLVDSTLERPVR
jgi:hypothetical protein